MEAFVKDLPFLHNHGSGQLPQMKGNYYWRDPFLTSMIMGGRVEIVRIHNKRKDLGVDVGDAEPHHLRLPCIFGSDLFFKMKPSLFSTTKIA